MKRIAAFLAISVSAYALSFSVDMLLGALVHLYPSTFYIPVVTWLVIAFIAGFVALALWPGHPALAIPSVVIAVIAIIAGVVGHHYNFGTGAVMLVQASIIWFCARVQGASIDPR